MSMTSPLNLTPSSRNRRALQQRTGARTILCTPLLREGTPIGVITIRRTEVRPFSDKADRSAEDLRGPGCHRHRERAAVPRTQENRQLEHQTATTEPRTSEILGVIASSPTDIEPVLDAIAENAARVCGAQRCDLFALSRATCYACGGSLRTDTSEPSGTDPSRRRTPGGRAVLDRRTIHIHDMTAEVIRFPEQSYAAIQGFELFLRRRCCGRGLRSV